MDGECLDSSRKDLLLVYVKYAMISLTYLFQKITSDVKGVQGFLQI